MTGGTLVLGERSSYQSVLVASKFCQKVLQLVSSLKQTAIKRTECSFLNKKEKSIVNSSFIGLVTLFP